MTASARRPEKPFPALFVTALLLGVALNPVNSTLIATALEPIASDLGASSGSAQILIVSLYLACTVAQPTAGKLSELFGARRVLLVGCTLVLIGGFLGGMSTSLDLLIAARAIIGIGTSAGYPSAMYLVRKRAVEFGSGNVPQNVLAGLAIVGLALMAVGPPIGGSLVGALGWRATFFVDVPFALATGLLALIAIPRDKGTDFDRSRSLISQLDLAGICGFTALMIILLTFLLALPRAEWLALGSALALGFGFVFWEIRAAHPFFDVRALASNGALVRTFLRATLTMLGSYVVLYALPQWLQAAHSCPSTIAGLIVVPMGVVSAILSTWVSRHESVKRPFIAAGAAMLVGGVSFACAGGADALLIAGIASTALGITLGANIAAGQLALYEQTTPERTGTAAGLLRTFTYFGSIGASVISGIVFQTAVTDAGMQVIGITVAALGIVVVLMTTFDRALQH